MKKIKDFYQISPEAKKNKLFVAFYRLYNEGDFLKESNPIREQEWDEKAYKLISTYCAEPFKNNYLLGTGRRWGVFSPIQHNRYGEAVNIIKHFIDNDFDKYINLSGSLDDLKDIINLEGL